MCLGNLWVDVGIGEPVRLDAREKPEGSRICDVIRLCLAASAGEEATNAAKAIDNDRTGVATVGELTRAVIVGENCPLLRGLVHLVGEVLTEGPPHVTKT